MLNRNKALTNFIVGYITSILMVVLFLLLAETTNGFIGNTSGTSTSAVAGIAFGISFFVIFGAYAVTTLIFSTPENFKKAPLVLFLTTLMMSLAVAFSVGVIDYTQSSAIGTVTKIILIIMFSLSIMGLMWFVQEFNTKFAMSSISANRADEWEYNHFLELSFNKISVEHKDGYTELKYKNKTSIITFISEEVIERKIFLSGDMKTKAVADLEVLAQGDTKAAIVFLSNNLPLIEGESNKVSIIKNNDLFRFVKGKEDGK